MKKWLTAKVEAPLWLWLWLVGASLAPAVTSVTKALLR
jgi:hypothetical protein